MRNDFNLTPEISAIIEAQKAYLRATGWIKIQDAVTDNEWSVWVDGVTLVYCTFPAAVSNQLERDGYFGKDGQEPRFSRGLLNVIQISRDKYNELKALASH